MFMCVEYWNAPSTDWWQVPNFIIVQVSNSVLVMTWYYIHSTDALGPTAYNPICTT